MRNVLSLLLLSSLATVAGPTALFNFPARIALRSDGVLLVSDTLNNAVRAIDTQGRVSTVAGQPPG